MARGATGCGVSVVSFSAPPSTAGDHGRSTPFGLTAATANPFRVRCRAMAPCLRKRSRSIAGGGQAGGGCRAVTTSAARSQSSASASGRSASATSAPSASCVTQPASSHETPSESEGSVPSLESAVRGQPFLQKKRILGGPHQMQAAVFAAHPDIVAIAGNQDIGLRHRQRPNHGEHQHGGAGPAQRRP
jgi:hypothetical protein